MLRNERRRIDDIDRQLIHLLRERFSISDEIGRIKQVNCMEIYDPDREAERFDTYLKLMGDDPASDYIFEIMSKVMEGARKYQEDTRASFGLLGRKLGHSYSSEIHRILGGYKYVMFEREPEQVEEFLKKGDFKGINVTIPYKKTVMKYCDEITDVAKMCDSVNTIIKREDGTLLGDNTDYFGLRYMMVSAGINVEGGKCLVLGSGGVSGTVQQVLSDMYAREIVVISREGENNYRNIAKHYDADFIINATPVGMYPDNGKSPVEIKNFKSLKGVVDLIYNPMRTKLVLDAQKAGIRAAGGLQMLAVQAAAACERFSGKSISTDEIEKACGKLEETYENIVLIGMPGCGKSSIGAVLAKITGKKFVDIDKLIEEEEDRLPEQIILTDGIKAFRRIERRVLKGALSKKGNVIACGGGVVEVPENEYDIKENSKVVYIRRDINELPLDGRPVSQEKGVWELFEERGPKYTLWSDIQIDNEGIENTAIMIAALTGYYKKGEQIK